MRLLPFLLALPLAAPALAQEALDAEGFARHVTGQSFSIANPEGGDAYGVEHYFEGGRVTWRWLETGECIEGTWYETSAFPGGAALCFDYADGADTQCWRYVARGEGLEGTYLGRPDSPEKITGFLIEPAPGATFCEWLGA